MSRSWPRVMSPMPGRSTLMTSAPSQARSCVQVGPDCTWVKSRMRTPSSALPSSPNGLSETGGKSSLDVIDLLFRLLVHRLVSGARRVFVRVHPDIDHGGFAGAG